MNLSVFSLSLQGIAYGLQTIMPMKNFLPSLTFGLFIFLFPLFLSHLPAQNLQWWKPADAPFPVIDGRAWSSELKDTLQRLPGRAKSLVRPPVWGLSQQPAGLFLRFFSNAPQIKVRYQIVGSPGMPHMPATGVSGVDL